MNHFKSPAINFSLFIVGVLLILHVLSSCDSSQKKSTNDVPRKKTLTQVISPKNNTKYKLGDEVGFELGVRDKTIDIDSIILSINQKSILTVQSDSAFIWQTDQAHAGNNQLVLSIYLGNQTIERRIVNLVLLAPKEPSTLTYNIVNIYPHDPDAYTQGLLYDQGKLYESTGQRGQSSLRLVDTKTGIVTKKVDLSSDKFGEGITTIGDSLYMLTWESNRGIIYNKSTFDELGSFYYNTEGWGLTTMNPDTLIMSDGSHKLYLKSPSGFGDLGKIEVYDHKGKVDFLNELEYINGRIFANRYHTDDIYIINPKTGIVEHILNLTEIFDRNSYGEKIDVLNGIAFNDLTKTYYITGKWWPNLFEIKIPDLDQNQL